MEQVVLIDNDDELVVIPDECGDTMWDAVLQQQLNVCEVKDILKTTDALPDLL